MDIRQSPLYAKYMQSIGWKVKRIGKWQAFIKPFPLFGSFIKIQRIGHPFPEKEIINLVEQHRAFKTIIEPDLNSNFQFSSANRRINFQLTGEIFAPSKTIFIDLSTKEEMFNRFSESKRRAVRRAEKNKIVVKESADIEAFVNLKSKQMFPFGFLLSREIRLLWKAFNPKHGFLLLAFHSNDINQCIKPLAGVLLLFWQKNAYYWLASATDKGKKLFAPTLLVWEALKLSRKKGCTIFDFEGVFDPRFPKATKSWKGFTKFKEGFGGKEVQYPKPMTINLKFEV